MSRQCAAEFLRGSLINVTMKNLVAEEREMAEKKLNELLESPDLTKFREKFCQILSTTIRGDYEDRDICLCDYRLAVYRCIVYILYHKKRSEIFDDRIQLIKLCKTFIMNYMKQILNENRIPYSEQYTKIEGCPCMVAFKHLCSILDQNHIKYVTNYTDSGYNINGDIGMINLKSAKTFGKLIKKYEKHGVKIEINRDKILLITLFNSDSTSNTIKNDLRIKVSSFESNDDENNKTVRYDLEYQITSKDHIDNTDMIYLRNILPNDLITIFDLITNTPEEFVKKYGSEPTSKQISEYLNINIDEVKSMKERLKSYYFVAKGV